jgi:hypothetical protein
MPRTYHKSSSKNIVFCALPSRRIGFPRNFSYEESVATLHAGSKHAEIVSKQAEIVLKRAENTRKTVDWLVTFASISPSQRSFAYAGKAHGPKNRNSRSRARG